VSIEKHVVVVDRPDGDLSGIMGELDQLGFRVIWVPTLEAAVEFVRSNPRLSLLIASGSAVEQSGDDFIVKMKELEPGLPIVWGVKAGGGARFESELRPDRTVAEPFRVEELREVAARLLCEQFYPGDVVHAIKRATQEVLGPLGQFEIVGDAYLKANETVLSELSTVLTFSGGVSGHLIVGTDIERARQLYHRAFPRLAAPTLDKVEDLVGELCNQILGRINVFFLEYGVQISQASPLFIRSSTSTIRYRGQQPSLGMELADGSNIRMFVEYYLSGLGPKTLARRVPEDILGLGEIRYF
jgi:CheY-specific phosphatase CheX